MHFNRFYARSICTTFTVPEARICEGSKTRTTDTDYEKINRKKQELACES